MIINNNFYLQEFLHAELSISIFIHQIKYFICSFFWSSFVLRQLNFRPDLTDLIVKLIIQDLQNSHHFVYWGDYLHHLPPVDVAVTVQVVHTEGKAQNNLLDLICSFKDETFNKFWGVP